MGGTRTRTIARADAGSRANMRVPIATLGTVSDEVSEYDNQCLLIFGLGNKSSHSWLYRLGGYLNYLMLTREALAEWDRGLSPDCYCNFLVSCNFQHPRIIRLYF